MRNLELLAQALEYMEEHLHEEMCTDDIAQACFCSKSTIEKLFKCVNGISVRDYIIRRRMALAAREMVANQDKTILDIALQYGYSTPESFTRAFSQVWNCSPSTFRKKDRTVELFPRMVVPLDEGDKYMNERKHFDISELYDLLKNRKDCYFVGCDIKNLVPINEVSYKAGDIAIIESLRRMEEAAGEEDVVFRIGGDEFVMITNSTDVKYAESIMAKINSKNGELIDYKEKDIPLSLYTAVFKVDVSPLKYDKLFTQIHTVLCDSKYR